MFKVNILIDGMLRKMLTRCSCEDASIGVIPTGGCNRNELDWMVDDDVAELSCFELMEWSDVVFQIQQREYYQFSVLFKI